MWAMPYAYLGPEGTFSEAALRAVDPGAEPLSCPTIQAALAAVRDGTAERAVVPIESSVEGVVTATLDDLATGNGMVIRAELQIPIAFALLARPGTAFGDIKRVGGHPQSMPQCRGWLAANLPDSEWVPLASNAEAARQAADGQVDAALAGAFAADRYGLAVIAPDVHDRASAVTRFVVVSPPGPLPARTGADRTSVALFLAEDHPGALLEILTEFAVRGINLTTIQSRPTGDRLGQYYFFIDCEGHVDDARVGEALMGVQRLCAEVRFLGSYPRSDGGQTQVRPGTSDPEFAEAVAAADAELAVDAAKVGVHGALADRQLPGYLLVAEPLHHQLGHPALAGGEHRAGKQEQGPPAGPRGAGETAHRSGAGRRVTSTAPNASL